MKNIILKKKKSFIFIIVLILLLIFYFFSTRQVYYVDYPEDDVRKPDKTDAEYLNIWDLRFASNDSDLKKLGSDLINLAYQYKGDLSDKSIDEKYKDMISEQDFSNLYALNDCVSVDSERRSKVSQVYFKTKKIEVKKSTNKAIIFYGYWCEAFDNKGDSLGAVGTYDARIYLEKENSKWIVNKVRV